MRSETPRDPLQGGGGILGITCSFVTYVSKIYLWKVMLNTISIQERTVTSFSHSFDVTFSQLIRTGCCCNSSLSVTVNYFV
jgi:hypothetical protein